MDEKQQMKEQLQRARDKTMAYLEEIAKRIAADQAAKIIEERKEKK